MIITKSNTVMSRGQVQITDRLRPIVQLATCELPSSHSLRARTHSIIIGRSGTGKSHLVRALAKELQLPIWEANVANWIVMGARSGPPTIVSLVDWISRTKKGIIFLDEIEAATSHSSNNSWYHAIVLELHSLLDARIPDGSIVVSDEFIQHHFDSNLDVNACRESIKMDVEKKLRSSFMIVAAGTWQVDWQEDHNLIGFNRTESLTRDIERRTILKSISSEILQRFRRDILFLETMTKSDYHDVLLAHVNVLPIRHRRRYRELAHHAIPKAVNDHLGMRIFEEIYTDLCVELMSQCAGDPKVFHNLITKH